MRTLQEKYNAVLEGNFSKTQFRRDAAIELPQFVSSVNSFDDTVAILKNKGIVTEAKKNERYFESDPADHISPDVLDTGIKCELEKKFNTTDVTPEQYEKAKETAVKNLTKDRAYYAKESGEQLETPAEQMEKVSLKEGKAEAWAEYQKKHNVTDKTVKVAKKDFEKEWEAGNLKKEGFLDRFKKKPAQSKPAPAKVLSADEIQAMIDQEAKTNTVGDILNAATVLGTIDLRNATPEQVKMFVSIARDSDYGHDTITGDNNMEYLRSLPNYKEVAEVNETVDTDELRARIANILKGQLTSLRKIGGDAIIEDYIETQIQAYLDGDVDIEEPMEVVNDFRYYMDDNSRAAADFNAGLEPDDTTPESPKKDDDEEGLGEDKAEPSFYDYPENKHLDDRDPEEKSTAYRDRDRIYLKGRPLKERAALKEMFKKIIVNLINE